MTKTQFRQISTVGDVAITYGTQLLLVLVKFGTGVLTARLLGATGKGVYVLAFYIPGILSTLGNLAIGQSLIYRLRRQELSPQQMFAAVLIPVVLISALIIGAYWLLLPLLQATTLRDVDPDLATLTILVVPVMLLSNYVSNVFRGLGRILIYNLFNITKYGLVLIGLVTGFIFLGTSAQDATYATLAAYAAISLILLAALFAASYPLASSLPARELINTTKLGLKYHTVQVLSFMEYRFDVLVLATLLPPDQVGIYSVAVTIAQLPWLISHSLGTVLFPKVISLSPESAAQFTGTVIRNSVALHLLAVLGLALFGYPIISLAYGAEFQTSYFVFLLLGPGIVVNALFRVTSSYFSGIGQPLTTARVSLGTLIANILLNVLLIPSMGIFGAALASLITYSASGIVMFVIFIHHTGLPWQRTLLVQKSDWRRYKKLATGLLAVGLRGATV